MYKPFVICAFALCITAIAWAKGDQPKPGFVTKAKVVSVHDGDTLTVEIKKTIHIRMLGLYAKELTSKDPDEKKGAYNARARMRELAKVGEEVTIEIPLEENIGKSLTLGRFLGTIWKDVDGDGKEDNLSEIMVSEGHGVKEK